MVPSGAAAAPSVRTPPVNSNSSFESGGRIPGDQLGADGVCAKVRVAFSIKQTTSLLNIVILSIGIRRFWPRRHRDTKKSKANVEVGSEANRPPDRSNRQERQEGKGNPNAHRYQAPSTRDFVRQSLGTCLLAAHCFWLSEATAANFLSWPISYFALRHSHFPVSVARFATLKFPESHARAHQSTAGRCRCDGR